MAFNSPSNFPDNKPNNDGAGSPYEGPAYDTSNTTNTASPIKKPRNNFTLIRIAIILIVVGINYYTHDYHGEWKPKIDQWLSDNLNITPTQYSSKRQGKQSWNIELMKDTALGNPSGTFIDTIDEETQNSNLLHLDKINTAPFSVNVVPPMNLSGKTRYQIKQLRNNSIANISYGFDTAMYEPFSPIFDGIQDGKPWWGLEGITIYGAGQHAIQGNSYRSNSLLNPIALIWPNVWDITFPSNNMIDLSHTVKNGKVDPNFPYLPTPKMIFVDPVSHTISMHIDVSSYNKAIDPYMLQTLAGQVLVEFEGINARDLGYPFIAFESSASKNMTKRIPSQLATRDFEYYHTGGSCGYSDGCNNLSPKIEALDDYVITQLPARAQFKLWHKKPSSFADDADIVYTVYFD